MSAVLYSYINSIPLLVNKLKKPSRFSTLNLKKDIFNSTSQLEIWEQLMFIMSLSGVTPLSDKIASIRLFDDSLKVYTNNSRMINMKFKKLTIFNDEEVSGLPQRVSECNKYLVLDWIHAKSCDKHLSLIHI